MLGISPDRGDGARMSLVRLYDTPTGLKVTGFGFDAASDQSGSPRPSSRPTSTARVPHTLLARDRPASTARPTTASRSRSTAAPRRSSARGRSTSARPRATRPARSTRCCSAPPAPRSACERGQGLLHRRPDPDRRVQSPAAAGHLARDRADRPRDPRRRLAGVPRAGLAQLGHRAHHRRPVRRTGRRHVPRRPRPGHHQPGHEQRQQRQVLPRPLDPRRAARRRHRPVVPRADRRGQHRCGAAVHDAHRRRRRGVVRQPRLRPERPRVEPVGGAHDQRRVAHVRPVLAHGEVAQHPHASRASRPGPTARCSSGCSSRPTWRCTRCSAASTSPSAPARSARRGPTTSPTSTAST